jgi:tetratricopeptide (TPR) repeat protein
MNLGSFSLSKRLGHGGMGDVWLGHHDNGLAVAIKVLRAPLPMSADDAMRVQGELQALASLPHPGIVQLLDHGVVAAGAPESNFEPGQVWMAMEYCDGRDLANLPPLSWDEFEPLLRDALAALAFAHAHGVLHRDIKPDNMLRTGTSLKLADFGLAFSLADPQRETKAAGTPHFMAPEQLIADWRSFGPSTDLYALGCTIWRLLCGRDVFHHSTSLKKLAQAKLSALLPAFAPMMAVPTGLNAWLNRNLQRRPIERFGRAADALAALDFLGPGWQPATPAATPKSAPKIIAAPGTGTEVSHPVAGGGEQTLSLPVMQQPTPPPSIDAGPVVAERRIPTLAADWRAVASQPAQLPQVEAGLALFNLRPIPYVGREQARDILWSAARRLQGGAGGALLLEGPAGTGKTRLAAWFAAATDRGGAVQVLRAQHTGMGAAAEGIQGLLMQHFQSAGLGDQELERLLERRLHELGASDPYAWQSLAAIIRPRPGAITFANRLERFAAVSDYLGLLALKRPVLLVFEDVHWGAEAVVFALHLLRRGGREGWPILVVMTLRDDLIDQRPIEARALAALALEDNVTRVAVPAMNETAYAGFVDGLLPMAPATRTQVIDASRGRPLYAVHLVADWVRRGALSLSENGFVLTSSATTLPDSLHALWLERLESVGRNLGAAAREALELVAALGGEIDGVGWRSLIAHQGLAVPADLQLQLMERGLALASPSGWRLCHGLLTDSVMRAARDGDRATDLHRRCADWSASFYPAGHPGRAANLGRHLLAAERPGEALPHLVAAAEEAMKFGDFAAASAVIDDWVDTLRIAGRELLAEEQTDGLIARCRIDAALGRNQAAINTARDQAERAEAGRWRLASGRWKSALGAALLSAGDPFAALPPLRAAVASAAQAGDQPTLDHSRRKLAETNWRCGRFDTAIALCEQSLAQSDSGFADSPEGGLLRCTYARALGAAGRHREALASLETLISDARVRGWRLIEADAQQDAAEVLRRAGDLSAAQERYQRSRMLYAALQSNNLVFAEANLALVALSLDDLDAAGAALERIDELIDDAGDRGMRGAVAMIHLAHHAKLGDWPAVAAKLRQAEELLRGSGYADNDLKDCFAQALAVSAEAPKELVARLQAGFDEQQRLLDS